MQAKRLVGITLAVATAVFVLAGVAAAAAPIATTGPVSSVGSTTATVTGTVTPGGVATTWRIEYGTTTSYGQSSANASAGNGTSPVDVTRTLTGLQPATTYHYRLVATNADGTGRGADGIFTTTAPPAVTTGAASNVTGSSATVAGTVDPNGLETSWFVEFGTTTAYGSDSATKSAGSGTSAVAVSASLGGLQAGKTYHYRLVATNAAGTSRGADATFTTGSLPVATTGSASAITGTTAKLAASIDPNGVATVGWFEWGTSTAYGSRSSDRSLGSGTSATSLSETIGGLKPGTTYHYRALAKSAVGTVTGANRTFTTKRPPSATTGPVSEVSSTGARLNGWVVPNGTSTSWWFEYGTTTQYGSRTSKRGAGAGTSASVVSVRISSLRSGTEFHARLVAESSQGRTYGADVSFRTASPAVAVTANVTARAITWATVNGRVQTGGLPTVWWVEYGRSPALGFSTPRRSLGSGPGEVGVSHTLTRLGGGLRYFYRVVAESSAGRVTGTIGSFGTAAVPRSLTGQRVRCTIVGTMGPDVLVGTRGRDVICGLGGNDRIRGLGGADFVVGGPGDDRVEGGAGADRIEGGAGRDLLFGGAGADSVFGGAFADELLGGGGRDRLLGGGGADSLSARDGLRDVVDGGSGTDRAAVDARLDRQASVERRLR